MADEPMTNIIIRVPVGLKRMMESCAKDADQTVSQILRAFMRDYTKKNYKGDLFAAETEKRKK